MSIPFCGEFSDKIPAWESSFGELVEALEDHPLQANSPLVMTNIAIENGHL